MRIGTKSVLYGAHCAVVHPWFLAAAWWKLYGFPWDIRLWCAFWLHDVGYFFEARHGRTGRGNTRGAWRQNHGLPLR